MQKACDISFRTRVGVYYISLPNEGQQSHNKKRISWHSFSQEAYKRHLTNCTFIIIQLFLRSVVSSTTQLCVPLRVGYRPRFGPMNLEDNLLWTTKASLPDGAQIVTAKKGNQHHHMQLLQQHTKYARMPASMEHTQAQQREGKCIKVLTEISIKSKTRCLSHTCLGVGNSLQSSR